MRFLRVVTLTVFILSAVNSFAQTIKGKISATDHQPLNGINIQLDKTFIGTVSDQNGFYQLNNVKPGTYIVMASGVGHEPTQQTVTLEANEVKEINFILKPSISNLKEVTITASRRAEMVDRTPASVQVIGAKELANQSIVSPNLSAMLANAVPSLAFGTNTTSNTGQTLRGRNPLILIDGIPQSTPLRNGTRDIRTIDPSVIERIEVVKGATSIYGNGGDGGVINYITKKPQTSKPFEAYSYLANTGMPVHSDKTMGGRFVQQFSGRLDKFDYVVSGNYEHTGVYKSGDGVVISPTYGLGETNMYNAYAKLGYNINSKQRIEGMYNYYGSEQKTDYVVQTGKYGSIPTIGVPGKVLGEPGGTRYNHNAYVKYMAKDLFAKSSLEASAYLQSFYTIYGYEPTYFENGGQSTILSNKKGARVFLNTPFRINKWIKGDIVYGLDLLNDKTGQPLVDGRIWVPDMSMVNLAPYAQANVTLWNDWIVRLGYRYDNINIDIPDFTQVKVLNSITGEYIGGQTIKGGKLSFNASSFNAGLRYSKYEYFKPFISFSQGFSMVDIGRYVRSAKEDNISKMQIQPVKVNNYEAGFSSNFGWLQFTGAYFISTNKIGTSLVQDSTGWLTQQTAPEKTYGYELSVDVTPIPEVGFGGSYTYVEGKADKNNNNRFNDKEDIYLIGSKISPPKASAYVRYAPVKSVSLYTQWGYFGDRKRFAPKSNGKYNNGEAPVNGVGVLNFTGSWQINQRFKLSLGVENLLNTDYFSPIAQWSGMDNDYTKANGMRYQLGVGINW